MPEAVTEKLVFPPAITVTFVGWILIVGRDGAVQLQAPGPPFAPMSFVIVPREGGKQTSLKAGFGFPASMHGEPSTMLKLVALANRGFKLIFPTPVNPP